MMGYRVTCLSISLKSSTQHEEACVKGCDAVQGPSRKARPWHI